MSDQTNVIPRGRAPIRPEARAADPQTGSGEPRAAEPRDEEDPRERAARRAAEIRAQTGGSLDDGVDMFRLENGLAPPGWTYEWKTKEVMGEEQSSYLVSLRLNGWDMVPAKRHPELMPTDSKLANIERKGMVLMERPTEIVEEARAIERKRARDQVRGKEEQLNAAPDGHFDRSDPRVRAKVSHSYEPIPIPKD